MKRAVLTLVAAITVALFFTGCQDGGGNEDATTPQVAASSAAPTAVATSVATARPIEGDALNRAAAIAEKVELDLGGDLFAAIGEVANNSLLTVKFDGGGMQTGAFGGSHAQVPASTVSYTLMVRVPESLMRPADNATLEKASETLLRLTAEHILPLPKDTFGYLVIRVFSGDPTGYYATMVTREELEQAGASNSYGALAKEKLVGGPVYLQLP